VPCKTQPPAGALGIVQAVLSVLVVWYACFWLYRKLRVDDEFGAMLSTAVSICGVSAAIAACGAIQGRHQRVLDVAPRLSAVRRSDLPSAGHQLGGR